MSTTPGPPPGPKPVASLPADPAFPRSEEEFDPVESYRMPLMEHLRELRRRIIIVLVAVGVAFGICYGFVDEIWRFLVAPMDDALAGSNKQAATMAMTQPMEGIMTYLKVAGVAAIGLASPIIFWELWRFIAPGLYPKEKKLVLPLVFASTLLFALGAVFCYYVIFGLAFPFFIGITGQEVAAFFSISAYLSFVTRMLVAFGVCFQMPVVIFFLARVGLIDHKDLTRFFRYAMVGIFIVAAVLTPPDVLSQLLMAVPLVLLYGLGIGVAWAFSTKVREEE